MMHQHTLLLIVIGIGNLIISTIALPTTLTQSRRLETTQRDLGLGKYQDGPETEVDCSITKYDFEYYFERCYDTTTQWSANGNCINGIKTEISELHKCMRPDGSVPYCHDCVNNVSGQIKHVCGSDNSNLDEVCPVAQAVSVDSCIDDSYMAVYSYQCTSQTTSYYVRDVIDCDDGEASSSGPWTNIDVDEAQGYVCGQEWYYAYDLDDLSGEFVSEGSDLHPLSVESNKYCLNCGKAIQICVANEKATCEDLGLPKSSLVGARDDEGESIATTLTTTSTTVAPPSENMATNAVTSSTTTTSTTTAASVDPSVNDLADTAPPPATISSEGSNAATSLASWVGISVILVKCGLYLY